MLHTIFQNKMQCLLCQAPVARPELGGGYVCTEEQCPAFYLNNGFLDVDCLPECYELDGTPPIVIESISGCLWYYCQHHEEYERDSSFDNPICQRIICDLTPLLSG